MQKIFINQSATTRRRQIGAGAFTFTELLVVMGSIVMLAAALLSVAFTTQERVLRAQCTDNLRQIGVGWNIYQQEFNQVMPCHWKGVTENVGGTPANPWETYEVYRVIPGTGQISSGYDGYDVPDGPWNLAVLFSTKLVPSPKIFYCPSLARFSSIYSYDYYATPPNTWPSSPASASNPYVRTGYNYYPQLRTTQVVSTTLGLQLVPQGAVTPTKWTALDTKKSIVTDIVFSYPTIAHTASGSVAGLNALFPDGHVTFQNVRSNPQDFDIRLWGYAVPNAIGDNPANFRYVMSLWQP